MLPSFLDFLKKEKLIEKNQRVLLAVSGGVDSVVMCDLFRKAGISFGIAHCNFNLRGKESDRDEQGVRTMAQKCNVPFYCKSFNTSSFSKRKKISVQMAARELRYEWLKRLAADKKYGLIATAHHLDDSIETFFINILRGTGIAGLQGIPVRQGNIVRPLLFATKKMIRDYAEENNLTWREDSSNFTDKYLRNNIRHHLIPALKKLNLGFENTLSRELSYFKDAASIFKSFMEEKKKEIVSEDGKNILLNIKKLRESGYAETLLHELLRNYDFTPETTELIAKRLYTTAGKKFLSPTYRLIKDRDFLILTRHSKEKEKEFLLKENQDELITGSLHLKVSVLKGGLSAIKDKSPSVAYLDLSKLRFPLKVRHWKQGDYFYPLGMKGRKKLSDFFVDEKMSVAEKENIWLLESDGNIAWIIGFRLDNRFKIGPDTKKILKVALPH